MKNLFYFIIFLFSVNLFAQDFPFPVSGEFNQTELKIENISISGEETVVTLSVMNKMESGAWYCADKNIYLYSKDLNKRFYLTDTENIPTCPSKYEFKSKGEILKFKLIFPSIIGSGIRIDLIEECNNSCFYFKDIILDNKLNSDIHIFDLALNQYENGNISQSAINFESILNDIPLNPTHVYGFAYSYLYKIALQRGDSAKAEEWKSEFMKSDLPNKDYYLKNFNAD